MRNVIVNLQNKIAVYSGCIDTEKMYLNRETALVEYKVGDFSSTTVAQFMTPELCI